MEFTTVVVLHKLKWRPGFEKSVEKTFAFGPFAAPECHLDSWGLIPWPLSPNMILTFLRIWPKLCQKLGCWKIPKDKPDSNGLFLGATLSQHTASHFQRKLFTGNFSGWAKNWALVGAGEFTAVVLHKLKWRPGFEKSVVRTFEFSPFAAPGAHSGALWLKWDIENLPNMAKNGPETKLMKNF